MKMKLPWLLLVAFGFAFGHVAPLHSAVTNYVTRTADSGPGSLRQAITDSLSGDVIRFRTNGVITLTSGELSITNNVNLIGPGASILAISGNNSSRVFNIPAGATTSISGLTIRDGRTTNGASSGSAGGLGSPGVPGEAGGHGGGIFNSGALTLTGCILLNNVTGNGGNGGDGVVGGVGGQGGAGGSGGTGGNGGGFYNMGTAKIYGCSFSGNSTGNGGAGGSGGNTGPPRPRCFGSHCYGGFGLHGAGGSGGHGGAIWHEQGNLWIAGSSFIGNACGFGGRGGTNGWPGFGLNGSGGSGGGIYNRHSLVATNCSFVGNKGGPGVFGSVSGSDGMGGNGGAVHNEGTFTVLTSSFSDNSVWFPGGHSGNGGAISSTGTLSSVASTFSGNFAGGDGGAIYNTGSLDLRSCTLSGNSCNAPWLNGGGGGIWSMTSREATISGGTIVSNQAFQGAGILNRLGSTRCVIRGTLIAGNLSTSPNRELFGAFESRGHNLVGTGGSGLADGINGDLVGSEEAPINPFIGPLQDNGSPVFTHALLAGSPAIDAGRNSGVAFDARGQPRTIDNPAVTNASGGDGTDIGALEVNHVLIGTEVRTAGNDVRVRFTSVSDKTYGVEYRPEVGEGPWTELPGTIVGTGGFATYTDVNAATLPRRFYRIFERAP
jgi:predicted outer membrane repeat protein